MVFRRQHIHPLLLFYVIAWITGGVTIRAVTRHFVTGGTATLSMGEIFKKVELQRKQEGREALPGTTHSSMFYDGATGQCAIFEGAKGKPSSRVMKNESARVTKASLHGIPANTESMQ